ncbi:MAG: LysM peptidoglycan-binding domain-containing protein [Patescibacteria group bacterium]
MGQEKFIRTSSRTLSRRLIGNRSKKRPLSRRLQRIFTRSRKRFIRFALLSANLALLIGVVAFVAETPSSGQAAQSVATISSSSETETGPLDQVSSADIAVHLARVTGLPEAVSVVNHADSISAIEATAPADTSVVAKPQVVSSALPTRNDIQKYVTQPGDTLSSLATKFGVTSDSIRWSNSITGSTVAIGIEIVMPPNGMNGIVYTVKAGDTPDSLAKKYNANKDLITSFNDAEVVGLKPGEHIMIPDGSIVAVAAASTYNYYAYVFPGGGGYDRGWCTDYASRKGGAPGGWGNANTWAIFAARTPGWVVSSIPKPGAIAQTSYGWAGHVGIVESVSEDGAMIKYSDMNGVAGFNRVGYSDWVPVHSAFQKFIYR